MSFTSSWHAMRERAARSAGWSNCVTALLFAATAHAGCTDELPNARVMGAGDFCVLGFCLYDARLLADRPPVGFDRPFALELTYRRGFSVGQLVGTGMREIDRLAATPLPDDLRTAWRADMARAFADVAPGDTLCGAYLPAYGVRFYRNGQRTADVADPAFAHAFFSIWLDPRTRAPALRSKLLGGS
ncbi:hypothetical protein BLA18112_02471 [Burkholderia lata]|uniref:Chalcone isomerase domain-containing protein n=1 Tax=Burkholderia lata (strain ATCC 17760 / DSM 23089 / LMG 22485 / NCIMB 9086 / R18194 / 383) TaxID=482957 RepID=A0A6P2VA01_BURL3|nr:hypothetical protein BLA18112_02471 [Burkholderia lata]